MTYNIPIKQYKTNIRQFDLPQSNVGGEYSLPFMISEAEQSFKPALAIEILMNVPKNYPSELKSAWGNCIEDMVEWAKEALKLSPDFLALKFNVIEEDLDNEIPKASDLLKKIELIADKPLIISGVAKKEVDSHLLCELAQVCTKQAVIGPVEEDDYKQITPALKEKGHCVIARTPIDVNLAKELNILISEIGISPDKILIDPNMGALGYGLDYAYSVIERIKTAGLGADMMLNMPIVTYVGEEAWKSKESKSADFPYSWGDLTTRAVVWECITASSVMSAGSNLLLLWHPESFGTLKDFVDEVIS